MYPGDKVRHRTKPSEPFAQSDDLGVVIRTSPAYRTIPAAALVGWGEWKRPDDHVSKLFDVAPKAEYETWENQKDLVLR